MSERAAGKLPERATHPAQAQHQPQASETPHDGEDGEADEEDGVRELNPTGEMESWLQVMDHAHKLGMPKWAQSLSLRLFELDRDQVRMEDRINPQFSEMMGRVDPSPPRRYDGIERQLEELTETLHDGLDRLNSRTDRLRTGDAGTDGKAGGSL